MLTPAQFAEWAAFYAQEPWGFEALDLLHASSARWALVAAGAKELPGPAAFMLRPPEDAEAEMEPTPAETREALRAMFHVKR